MKTLLTICMFIFSTSLYSQSNQDKARAYLKQAKTEYSDDKFTSCITTLDKIEGFLGSSNAEVAALKTKSYFKLGQYETAKVQLNKFFEYEATESLKNEMLDYIVMIDDKIESSEIVEDKKQGYIIRLNDKSEIAENTEQNLISKIDAKREIVENKEDVMNDVPFSIIEDVPVFIGCKGDKAALKKCFNTKIQEHYARKFDYELPNKLGLPSGKIRLIVMFKIDETGNIVDIRVRAPHPKLREEAIRVTSLLPRMKPGKQRGKPIGVKYTLPLVIKV